MTTVVILDNCLEVSKMTVPICTSHWCCRYCHVRIEKGPVQTVAIILEAHNSLEYHNRLLL